MIVKGLFSGNGLLSVNGLFSVNGFVGFLSFWNAFWERFCCQNRFKMCICDFLFFVDFLLVFLLFRENLRFRTT